MDLQSLAFIQSKWKVKHISQQFFFGFWVTSFYQTTIHTT